MQWVRNYLTKTYQDGGRGPDYMDCWGLVREARAQRCGKRLLPEHGSLRKTDPRAITRAYDVEAVDMEACQPEHGAIAAVLHGKVCVHVALVVEVHDELWILEMNPVRDARFLRLGVWMRDIMTVTFYRDIA